MGIFDKLKETASGALDGVKNAAADAKNKIDASVAEKQALNAELTEKADAMAQELASGVEAAFDEAKGMLFNSIDEKYSKTFAKEYYEKMVLPGSRTSTSCIVMHPYLDTKQLSKISKKMSSFDATDEPLLHIKDSDKQELVFSNKALYFKIALPENPKFYAEGRIPMEKINEIAIEISDSVYTLLCNGVKLMAIRLVSAYKQDAIAIAEYFRRLKENYFEISEEEVDSLIHRKISDKIYESIKKYMTYDDEMVLYYAGGLDDLTANDYIACTNKQIIIVNREMFGMTANVKQFYYEDVTAMQTLQNSNSGDFTTDLLLSALTAATKTCDLEISVAGSKEKISTLFTLEAQRVIGIYHEQRKKIKEESKMPQQTIIQQAAAPDAVEQLAKLAKLKEAGILTEDEFNAKKTELLAKM